MQFYVIVTNVLLLLPIISRINVGSLLIFMVCEKNKNVRLDPLKLPRKPLKNVAGSLTDPQLTILSPVSVIHYRKREMEGRGVSIYRQLLTKRFSFFLGRVVTPCSKWGKAMIQILKVC